MHLRDLRNFTARALLRDIDKRIREGDDEAKREMEKRVKQEEKTRGSR